MSSKGQTPNNKSIISPLPKPDFSSIEKKENSLSFHTKGSFKKKKAFVPESPVKKSQKYFTPHKVFNLHMNKDTSNVSQKLVFGTEDNCKGNLMQNFPNFMNNFNNNAQRKLNFGETDNSINNDIDMNYAFNDISENNKNLSNFKNSNNLSAYKTNNSNFISDIKPIQDSNAKSSFHNNVIGGQNIFNLLNEAENNSNSMFNLNNDIDENNNVFSSLSNKNKTFNTINNPHINSNFNYNEPTRSNIRLNSMFSLNSPKDNNTSSGNKTDFFGNSSVKQVGYQGNKNYSGIKTNLSKLQFNQNDVIMEENNDLVQAESNGSLGNTGNNQLFNKINSNNSNNNYYNNNVGSFSNNENNLRLGGKKFSFSGVTLNTTSNNNNNFSNSSISNRNISDHNNGNNGNDLFINNNSNNSNRFSNFSPGLFHNTNNNQTPNFSLNYINNNFNINNNNKTRVLSPMKEEIFDENNDTRCTSNNPSSKENKFLSFNKNNQTISGILNLSSNNNYNVSNEILNSNNANSDITAQKSYFNMNVINSNMINSNINCFPNFVNKTGKFNDLTY